MMAAGLSFPDIPLLYGDMFKQVCVYCNDGIMIISVIVPMLTNYLGTVRNDSDNMDLGMPLRYLTAASFFPDSEGC